MRERPPSTIHRQQQHPAQTIFRRTYEESVRCYRRERDCCGESEEREPVDDDDAERAPLCYPISSANKQTMEIGEGSSNEWSISQRQRLVHGHVRASCHSEDTKCEDDGRTKLWSLINRTQRDNSVLTSTIHNVGNVQSIDQRFGDMTVQKARLQQERRRAQRRALQQEKSVATRRRVLMNALGMQRFYKALAILKEIKGLREKLLRSCCTIAVALLVASNSTDDKIIPNREKQTMLSKEKFEALPLPGRNLLFNTNLVVALEQTPLEQLAKLPWDELLLQAQQNCMAYKEWMSLTETRE